MTKTYSLNFEESAVIDSMRAVILSKRKRNFQKRLQAIVKPIYFADPKIPLCDISMALVANGFVAPDFDNIEIAPSKTFDCGGLYLTISFYLTESANTEITAYTS